MRAEEVELPETQVVDCRAKRLVEIVAEQIVLLQHRQTLYFGNYVMCFTITN